MLAPVNNGCWRPEAATPRSHKQPTHVRKEEAAICVVRIGVGIGPFVVAAMITRPIDYVILERERVAADEEEAQRKARAIAAMR